jgi:hypothetical protein
MPTEVGIHAFRQRKQGVDGGPPPAMTAEAQVPMGQTLRPLVLQAPRDRGPATRRSDLRLSTFLFRIITGGAEGNRTPDLLNAIQALSQLSYGPDP